MACIAYNENVEIGLIDESKQIEGSDIKQEINQNVAIRLLLGDFSSLET